MLWTLSKEKKRRRNNAIRKSEYAKQTPSQYNRSLYRDCVDDGVVIIDYYRYFIDTQEIRFSFYMSWNDENDMVYGMR